MLRVLLLAYQNYSNLGLNSPGVLKAFDLADEYFHSRQFHCSPSAYLPSSAHFHTRFRSAPKAQAVLPLTSSPLPWALKKREAFIHLVTCLHKQEYIDKGESMLWGKLILDEHGFFKPVFIFSAFTGILYPLWNFVCLLFIFWDSSGCSLQNTARISRSLCGGTNVTVWSESELNQCCLFAFDLFTEWEFRCYVIWVKSLKPLALFLPMPEML